MSIIIVGLDGIVKGSVIQYVLRPSQQPTDPNRRWKGRVETVTRNANLGMCYIRSLESGYEEFGECVFFDQIVSVENKDSIMPDLRHRPTESFIYVGPTPVPSP